MPPITANTVKKSLAVALSSLGLAISSGAQAWDAGISVGEFGNSLYVSSWSGSWSWLTQQEGVGTTFGLNSTVPNSYIYQAWDGNAWPSDYFEDQVDLPSGTASAVAYWQHDAIDIELARGAEAYIYGGLVNGESMGAQFVYDFQFILDPFSTATIRYDDADAWVYLESQPGEQGNAFGELKLYSTDVDLNDFGGVNNAYFEEHKSLGATSTGGLAEGYLSGMAYTFSNTSGEAQTYNLRLQGAVYVFTSPVPEPASYALMLAGLALVGMIARRRDA